MHVSNIKQDECLERRLLPSGFGCPLCPHFKTESDIVIQRHLSNHAENAVHFQDYIICSCNLFCRAGGHFHCPFCDKTIIRKADVAKHLSACQKKCDVVQPTLLASCKPSSPETQPSLQETHPSSPETQPSLQETQPSSPETQPSLQETQPSLQETQPSSPETQPSLQETQPLTEDMETSVSVDHSYELTPPVYSQTPDHSYAQTSSPKDPTLATDFDQPTPETTSDPPMIQKKSFFVRPTHKQCPHCPLILYKRNLVVHIQRTHSQLEDVTASSHLKNICVDQHNGIYAVRKTYHGFSAPIHVQRKTWGLKHHTKCELEDCDQYNLLMQRNELSHKMCHHIRSVDYCSGMAPEEPLRHQVLEEMVENLMFCKSKVDVCKKRQKDAEEAQVPLSVYLDLCKSKNVFCFSIYEPKLCHYSTFGRVIVAYNINKNAWHCPCAKSRTTCTHKYIAKWHLFQKHKHLFMTAQLRKPASQLTPHARHPSTADLERAVKYVFKNKKIPAPLPEVATARRSLTEYSKRLFPDETTCQLCPDNPKLEEATQVTNKAKIVGIQGVIENVVTYNSVCSKCKLVYRYQEWRDGLHNFNDHVILTLQLCVYLRHNLQNQVSVSRVVGSLESLLEVNFPSTDLIFQGYCHFEALSNTECGIDPPLVCMDLYRKGIFSREVGELEHPNNSEQNMASFRESVHLHAISRGFFEASSQNPFVCPT